MARTKKKQTGQSTKTTTPKPRKAKNQKKKEEDDHSPTPTVTIQPPTNEPFPQRLLSSNVTTGNVSHPAGVRGERRDTNARARMSGSLHEDDFVLDEDSEDGFIEDSDSEEGPTNLDNLPLTFNRGIFSHLEETAEKQLFEHFDFSNYNPNAYNTFQMNMFPAPMMGMQAPHTMIQAPHNMLQMNMPHNPVPPPQMPQHTNHTPMDDNTPLSDDHSPKLSINIDMHDRMPSFNIVAGVNLFKTAKSISENLPGNLNPALSKPSFCPRFDNLFVCGTEEQDPNRKTQNHIIIGNIDNNSRVGVRRTQPINEHIRDIQWIDNNLIVLAANQKLGYIRLTPDAQVENIVMFPEFHKDTIREICVSEGNKNLVISGGFDGNVFVTDISRLVSDIQKNEKKSENSLYPCRDVVGSVNWHPYDNFVASCTTDTGVLHIFDIRTEKRRPAIVYDTAHKELYTHCYKDQNTLVLGYGDGSMLTFDMRNKKCINSFQAAGMKAIGEIRSNLNSKYMAVFGSYEFEMWSFDDNSISLQGRGLTASKEAIESLPFFKTSGEFRKSTRQLAVTDSCGFFSLYDYN